MILKKLLASSLLLGFGLASPVWADESTGEKVEETGRDVKRATKKGVNKIKDETCELVNGKMECTAKKVKHKVSEGVDNVKDKGSDAKNKVD